MLGESVSHYRIIERLGGGGMGIVYRAEDLRLGRDVALKFLPADTAGEGASAERFRREARVASALNHPNICTIYEFGEHEGQQFIAMEYVPGETLRQHLDGTPIPLRHTLDIAVQLTSALTVAHAAGIIHRDLKPENVMLRHDGLVKVVDFGLAKLDPLQVTCADGTQTGLNTDAGTVLGTVTYMSPEQARGQPVDTRTDIWAAGVMLYEMIAGRNPFAAQTSSEVLAAVLNREPAPIARFEPDAPAELQRIVSKTLSKDRERRYQGMKDLLIALQTLRRELETRSADVTVESRMQSGAASRVELNAMRSQSSAEYVFTQISTHKRGSLLVMCVVLLIVGGGWWAISRRSSARSATPSVAVLFKTIGGGDTYFADGITEAITTELGRAGGLRVIAANTAFRYRDKTGFREISRKLGVGLVVTGSVQRASETVRIDVGLVDTRDETALWSEHYSRALTDVLAVQNDISGQIAAALSRNFGASPLAAASPPVTANAHAYDAYLRGVWHLKARSSPLMLAVGTGDETRRLAAITELERAVHLDETFALARAALASAYMQRFFYDAPDPDFEQRAFLEIQRALSLNPNQAEAYLARAQLTWTLRNGFPHERAVKDLQRALSINPNLAEAYVELGKIYFHVGLTDKAVEANQQAQRLDPSETASKIRGFLALVDAGRVETVKEDLGRGAMGLGVYPYADALVVMDWRRRCTCSRASIWKTAAARERSVARRWPPSWPSSTRGSVGVEKPSACSHALCLRQRTGPGSRTCTTRSSTSAPRWRRSIVTTRRYAG